MQKALFWGIGCKRLLRTPGIFFITILSKPLKLFLNRLELVFGVFLTKVGVDFQNFLRPYNVVDPITCLV